MITGKQKIPLVFIELQLSAFFPKLDRDLERTNLPFSNDSSFIHISTRFSSFIQINMHFSQDIV